jgi:peptidyl-prolyl cis-trans isomerase B (cyclophilin B)
LIAGRFLSRFPSSEDYLVRQAAERWLPSAANLWGPSRPIATGRGIEDYRDLAHMVLSAERGVSRTEIVFETDRGDLIVELFPADAPFTVQAFLRLVDRRHFDGLVWHAVEPGVMVESGDQRGDGLANVVAPTRDESSTRSFQVGSLGLVLDGPDTGGNRFFITLRPSPELASTHTAFGRVVVGLDLLDRLTVSDRIRRVRRQ